MIESIRERVQRARDAYEVTDSSDDLSEWIKNLELLIAQLQPNDDEHATTAILLAGLLGLLWSRNEDETVWARGVNLVDEWTELFPTSRREGRRYLLAKGHLYLAKAMKTRRKPDQDVVLNIMARIQRYEAAGTETHAHASSTKAEVLLHMYIDHRDPAFLEAIILNAGWGSLFPDSPKRQIFFSHLAVAFACNEHCRWTAAEDNEYRRDLAVESSRSAVAASESKAEELEARLQLAYALRHRFIQRGQLEDLTASLEQADVIFRQVPALEPSETAQISAHKGAGLFQKYCVLGDPDDLDASINLLSQAMDISRDPEWDLPGAHEHLGNALTAQAVLTESKPLLTQAISTYRAGIEHSKADGLSLSRLYDALASAILIQYSCFGTESDDFASALDAAIEHFFTAWSMACDRFLFLPIVYRKARLGAARRIGSRLVSALLQRASITTEPAHAAALRRGAFAVGEAIKSPELVARLILRSVQLPDGGTVTIEFDDPQHAPSSVTGDLRRLLMKHRGEQLLETLELIDVDEAESYRNGDADFTVKCALARVRESGDLVALWKALSQLDEPCAQYVDFVSSYVTAVLDILDSNENSGHALFSITPVSTVDSAGVFEDRRVALMWMPDAEAPLQVFDVPRAQIDRWVGDLEEQVPQPRGAGGQPDTWWQALCRELATIRADAQDISSGDPVIVSPCDVSCNLPWALVFERAGWGPEGQCTPVVVLPSVTLAMIPIPETRFARRNVGRGDNDFAPPDSIVGMILNDQAGQMQSGSISRFTGAAHRYSGPLVIGNPSTDLPSASAEAQAIARILGVAPLLGSDATTEAVLGSAHGRTLIHVSAHVRVNREDPFETHIQLANGSIPIHRLLRLWINSGMVVVSSCESGRGSLTMGGEIISLSTVLMSGGSETVIASLWPVDDAATCYLMTELFTGMVSLNLMPWSALARAQERTRAQSGWANPYYWAGFFVSARGFAWLDQPRA
ncbi:CHAT domain-containing protein [Catellatospora tritici]|uniref:CHAT domain-containing protein n=1 Tax=Catellatospora tritici TaxID=2851566 RepID=UPI001C2CFDD3|nr:CHAT domain-containing protein [Catellatospora tritici]MBV1854291.1 CHAT domain-containing protein [Catellatospora tritici]